MERESEKEGEGSGDGGGGWSTFLKVAGAAVVVAGGIYSIVKEAKQKQVADGVGAGGGTGGGTGGSTSGGGWGMQTKEITVWTKPKTGWLKLNVDGSLRREIQSAGCGGVIRNEFGAWIYGFAQKLSPSSREDETEKEGILKGLNWAKEKGFERVEVESDNRGIVEKVESRSGSEDRLIDAIRELLDSPHWETELTWIRGSANRVADKLADIGRSLTSFDLQEYDYCPTSCATAFNNDLRLL